MSDIVYQVSAHEYTPQQAASEFARKWFAEPRQVERFANNRFTLVDGVAEYEIIHIPEVPLVSSPLWQIRRLLTLPAPDKGDSPAENDLSTLIDDLVYGENL